MPSTPALLAGLLYSRATDRDGGIEWNYSPGILGHWVGTEDHVWAAKITTKLGDVLRIYEFDRFNATMFQVDMLLYNGTLWAHPKTFNPNPTPLDGYWWTCVGQKFTSPTQNCKPSAGNPGSRIIAPATDNWNTGVNGGPRVGPWPNYNAHCCNDAGKSYDPLSFGMGLVTADMSYMHNQLTSADIFFDIPSELRPYVAIVDRDLFGPLNGLFHGHSLNGTKFWEGGIGHGSQRWYNWKDAPASPNHKHDAAENTTASLGGGCGDCGCFTELQTGVAKTQFQIFHIPESSTRQWTEFWKTMEAVPNGNNTLYDSDYNAVLKTVDEWVESSNGVPASQYHEMDKFFEEVAQREVTAADVLHEGSSWGFVHQELTGTRLSPSMYFGLAARDQDEATPWLELARDGTFKTSLSSTIPLSFQTTDGQSASQRAHFVFPPSADCRSPTSPLCMST